MDYKMTYKVPSNIKSAAKLLLTLLIEQHGGQSEVGRLCRLPRQTLFTSVTKGYVALPLTYTIAKKLKTDIWTLSYVKLMEVFGENSPEFSDIIIDCSLSSNEKEKIMNIYRRKL